MRSAASEEVTERHKVLVVIPTYDEIDNLPEAIRHVHAAVPTVSILVVDDGSPDGTGELAEKLSSADPRISVIHRAGKLGLGSAYLTAFKWGLSRGYEVLVEMDADGSHPATSLPAMLAALDGPAQGGSGFVIGSRWIDGGKVANWPKSREFLSRAGNLYARLALGIQIRDATAGYRVYRADFLEQVPFDEVDSYGYCFQIDLTLRALDLGYSFAEIPITFRERERGESKMSGAIVLEAMAKVTIWGLQRRIRLLKRFGRRRAKRDQAVLSQ